jgi:hypothetical protein
VPRPGPAAGLCGSPGDTGDQQERRVGTFIREVQLEGIAHCGLNPQLPTAGLPQLLHVQRHKVTMQDLVAQVCEPQRVPARAAADICHHGGRWWQVPRDDLFRPLKLELPDRLRQPPHFQPASVVLLHCGGHQTIGHDQIIATWRARRISNLMSPARPRVPADTCHQTPPVCQTARLSRMDARRLRARSTLASVGAQKATRWRDDGPGGT